MDSVEYYKSRCRSLEVENDRLKRLIQSMKDLLVNENVDPSTGATSCTHTTSSPILSGTCKSPMREDIYIISEGVACTIDFHPTTASSPLLQDMDETFYEPAEQIKEATPKDEKTPTTPTPSPQSPIFCSGQVRGARRRILCDREEVVNKKARSTMESSYDKIPELEGEPKYAYVGKPVRGLKRKMLPGRSCNNCEEYYTAANIPKTGINKCSRHRSKHSPVRSPKGYWSLDMPSTQWIRDRARNLPSPDKYA